ncbi:PLAT/LH2 domain-containing protein [Litorimonas sp.]|uniref:PLAT/LH2 domain-containing protein n=1 Tax=Litorimonas sp. TaxID=1892381 RepID=UPI003A84D5E4
MNLNLRKSITIGNSIKLALASFTALAVIMPASAFAATVDYYVHLKTGTDNDADTDGDVFIQLHGMGDDTAKIELDSSGDYDDFEKGDGRWYKISTDKTIGRIKDITLSLEGNDGWQVSFAYVVGPTLEKGTPTFPQTQAWLDGKKTITGDFYRFGFDNIWLDNDDSNWTNSRTVTRKDYEETQSSNVLAKPEGRWVIGCSNTQKCGSEVTSSVDLGSGTESTKTKDVGASIESSVSAGYAIPGGPSGDVTMTAGVSTALSNAISNSTSSQKSNENKCTTENEFKTKSTTVWQWQITADLGFQEKVRVNTCQLACTQSNEEDKNLIGKQPPLYDFASCTR